MRDVSWDAVIVSVARASVGRAYEGAFNATPFPNPGCSRLSRRSCSGKSLPDEIEDCIIDPWKDSVRRG